MFSRSATAFVAMAVCSFSTMTVADTVLNTFGPADAMDNSTPFPLSGGQAVAQAIRFTPLSGGSITQVHAALRANGGVGSSTLFISIVPEVLGAPGVSPIWTSEQQVVSGGVNPTAVTFVGSSSTTLVAGQRYWLLIEGAFTSGNAAVAHAGLPNVLGTRASRSGTGAWIITSDTVLPAVRIIGEIGGACCNPATGGCALLMPTPCAALGLGFIAGGVCTPGACEACPADINRSGGLSVQDLFDFLEAYFPGCP